MEITHKATGTVHVLTEHHPKQGDVYTFAFTSEEALKKWKSTAITNWLNSPENVEDVREWLASNLNWTVEGDSEFVFNEVSGIYYEADHCVVWELA